MSEQILPQVGDVITSPKFAYGYHEGDKKIITIDGKTRKRSVTSYMDKAEQVDIAAKTGKIPPKKKITELGAYDQNRASAKFVVESANMQGSEPGNGYPDGWHVKARRLNKDESYNPNNELICFYMSGCFSCIVEPKDVKITGKMKMKFV